MSTAQKTVLVTGAYKGIGLEVVRQLARRGARVFLTARQREILQLIAEGQNTKAIGSLLNVSPKTVEYHRAQLMERLNIYDIPGLVRFASRSGLVAQEI